MRTESKAAAAFVLISSVAFLSGREAGIHVEKKREAAKAVQYVQIPPQVETTFPSWENQPGIKQAAPSGTEDHPLYTQTTLEGRVDMLEGEVDFLRTMEQAREERELKAKRTKTKPAPAALSRIQRSIWSLQSQIDTNAPLAGASRIQIHSPCVHLTSGRWVAEGSSIRFDTRQKCEDYAAHPVPVNGARGDSLAGPDWDVQYAPPSTTLCVDHKTGELHDCGYPAKLAADEMSTEEQGEYCRISKAHDGEECSRKTLQPEWCLDCPKDKQGTK